MEKEIISAIKKVVSRRLIKFSPTLKTNRTGYRCRICPNQRILTKEYCVKHWYMARLAGL